MWETLRNTYENRKTNVGKPTKSVGNVAKKKCREKSQDTFKENRKTWENVGSCVAFVCLFLKVFASSRASCSCSNTSVYALSVPVSISLCCLLLFLSSSIFTTDLFCLYLSFSSCSALVFVPVPVSISLCCLAPCFIMYVSISFFLVLATRDTDRILLLGPRSLQRLPSFVRSDLAEVRKDPSLPNSPMCSFSVMLHNPVDPFVNKS